MINVYEKGTTATGSPLCALPDATECLVTEEANASYSLTLKYPVNGRNFQQLQEQRMIGAKSAEQMNEQLFEIMNIDKTLNAEVEIYAEHISRKLKYVVIKPFNIDRSLSYRLKNGSYGLFSILSQYAAAPYTNNLPYGLAETNITTEKYFGMDKPESLLNLLFGQEGSIVDLYGGTWQFSNSSASLWSPRGVDKGVRIEYGRNLTGLDVQVDLTDTYTSILPYWKGHVNDTDVWVYGSTQHCTGSENFAYKRVQAMDFSTEFTYETDAARQQPTAAELEAAARAYMTNNNWGPVEASVKVSFVPLWKAAGENDSVVAEHVNLGDFVYLTYEEFGITDLRLTVEKTVFDVLLDRYKSVELGNRRTKLKKAIENLIDSRVAPSKW